MTEHPGFGGRDGGAIDITQVLVVVILVCLIIFIVNRL